MPNITLQLVGLDKLQTALAKLPTEVETSFAAAGKEAGESVILDTVGLRRYPPPYHAPRPFQSDKQRRYFFAALRDGQIEVPYRRGGSPGSERYGTQFYVQPRGALTTAVGNRASYAVWLAGGGSRYMAAGSWRALADVLGEKVSAITQDYQAWVDRTIKKLGL